MAIRPYRFSVLVQYLSVSPLDLFLQSIFDQRVERRDRPL